MALGTARVLVFVFSLCAVDAVQTISSHGATSRGGKARMSFLESGASGAMAVTEDGEISCDALKHVPANVTALFINLDSRTDRKELFLNGIGGQMELFKRCKGWTLNRFKALDAHSLAEKAGASEAESLKLRRHTSQVAAASSHVSALKQAGQSSKGPVMIFEDDFHFFDAPASLVQRLDRAFEGLGDDWDVVMMGDHTHNAGKTDERLPKYGIAQTHGAWVSDAYMVNEKYLPRLLNTTSEGLELLENGAEHVHPAIEPLGAAFDTLWYPLQQDSKSKWIVFRPQIGGQRNTWGDSNVNLGR